MCPQSQDVDSDLSWFGGDTLLCPLTHQLPWPDMDLLVKSDWFYSLARVFPYIQSLFSRHVILETSLCVLRHPAGQPMPLSTCYCGQMCQSKSSHGESMHSPTCSPGRSFQGCFLHNQPVTCQTLKTKMSLKFYKDCFNFLLCVWLWEWNPGLCVCQASALPLRYTLQPSQGLFGLRWSILFGGECEIDK